MKIHVRGDDLCSFCKNSPETLCHLFWECVFVQHFWRDFLKFLSDELLLEGNTVDYSGSLSYKTVIFSSTDNELFDFLLLLGKQFIYRTKSENNILSIERFKILLRNNYLSEKYIALKNSEMEKFIIRWSNLPSIQLL